MGSIFRFYTIFDSTFCMETVENLIKRHVLLRLVWVCTVCICPQKGR